MYASIREGIKIAPENELVPNRHQAITWTSGSQDEWRQMASLEGNKLIKAIPL